MWKYRVFKENLRLTKQFFIKAGVKQPTYGEVVHNLFKDIFDFVFRHPKKCYLQCDSKILEEVKLGGIFLTAHYGNHELLGYRLAEQVSSLISTAQIQKPDFFNKWLQKKRTVNGKCFVKNIKPSHLINFIDNKGLFALIADQNFRKPVPSSIKDECRSEFLGLKVSCNPLPAFILKYRPNTPVFCGCLKQIKKIPSENFYKHYHLWLESLILENPARWYGWFHRRFY